MIDPFRDPVQVPQFRSRFGGFWTDLNNAPDLIDGKVSLGSMNQEEAQLLRFFVENGYLILRAAVDIDRIDELNRDIEKLSEDPPAEAWVNCIEDGHGVTRQMTSADKDEPDKMIKLLDLYSYLPSAREIVFAPQTMRLIKLIFERPVLAHQSLFFFKGSQQPIHQDTAFVRVSSPMELVASWTALEDIEPGSGELTYYPKSHQFPEFLFEGKYKWWPPGCDELGRYYEHLNECAAARNIPRTKFPARKGDVFIWSADFAHGGGEIDDPYKTRRSIAAHYCPINTYPMYLHYENSKEIIQAGDDIYYWSQKKEYWRSG